MTPQRTERLFLAVIVLLCAVLSALQFRWTGELGRAEMAGLVGGLQARVDQGVQAFDRELRQACHAIAPTAAEIDRLGLAAAHANRIAATRDANWKMLFTRVAVAPAAAAPPDLYTLSLDGTLQPMEWPLEWSKLHERIDRRRGGGPPPFVDPDTTLIEYPVIGADGREREWMIFEVDTMRAVNTWLPRIVQTFLTPPADAFFDVLVRRGSSSSASPLFSTRAGDGWAPGPPDATAAFFPLRFVDDRGNPLDSRQRPGGPREPAGRREGREGREGSGRPGPPGERGRGGPFEPPGRWVMEARYVGGSVDALVARSRWRNFALAMLLLGLVLAAAVALLRATRRARALADREMQFVAGISHELRTPLTVIRGAGHNLLTGIVREPAQRDEYARLIVRHADQLTGMLEQVLAFAGSRRDAAPAIREPVAAADIIDGALTAASEDVRASGCSVDVDIAPDVPAIAGDPAALRRALQNLVANAARHGAAGRWIGIRARGLRDGGVPFVEVDVADRGAGIPESDRDRVWEPFYRGERSRVRQDRGFGLGLSLVKGIVESHGGRVSFVSSTDGTVFSMRLPAAGAAS